MATTTTTSLPVQKVLIWNPWDLHTDPQHGGTRQSHRGAGSLPCWTPTVPHPDQDTDCQIHWHHGCSLDPLHIPKLGLLRGQTYLVLTEPKYKLRVNKTDRAIPIRPIEPAPTASLFLRMLLFFRIFQRMQEFQRMREFRRIFRRTLKHPDPDPHTGLF